MGRNEASADGSCGFSMSGTFAFPCNSSTEAVISSEISRFAISSPLSGAESVAVARGVEMVDNTVGVLALFTPAEGYMRLSCREYVFDSE